VRQARVRELLLGYLQAAVVPLWPGTDGLTMQDALVSYPQAAAAGRVPDLRQLLRDHPALAEELTALFAEYGSPIFHSQLFRFGARELERRQTEPEGARIPST
jgi:hypothetical protein